MRSDKEHSWPVCHGRSHLLANEHKRSEPANGTSPVFRKPQQSCQDQAQARMRGLPLAGMWSRFTHGLPVSSATDSSPGAGLGAPRSCAGAHSVRRPPRTAAPPWLTLRLVPLRADSPPQSPRHPTFPRRMSSSNRARSGSWPYSVLPRRSAPLHCREIVNTNHVLHVGSDNLCPTPVMSTSRA